MTFKSFFDLYIHALGIAASMFFFVFWIFMVPWF